MVLVGAVVVVVGIAEPPDAFVVVVVDGADELAEPVTPGDVTTIELARSLVTTTDSDQT